jgi:hypothetical protein
MSTTVVVPDWIRRIVDDERSREAARVREDEVVAQKADLVRRHGRRLVDELRAAMTRDLEAYRGEFPGDGPREMTMDATGADGGFVVRRPNLEAASMVCQYRFTLGNGLPSRDDRVDVLFARDGDAILQLKNQATGQVFATADSLSEFLLVPVLTARRR